MFHTLFYEPLYNLVAVLLSIMPLHDIGAAIIAVTIIVKGVLLPFNMSALRSQHVMKKIEGEMNELKAQHKDNPQDLSKHMMALYKREKINPFASLLVIVIQMPVLFALYFVVLNGLHADPNSLYSFVTFPEKLHTLAFGVLDVTQKSMIIAILTAVSSYVLARFQTSSMTSTKAAHEETFQDHFMKSMRIQLLYVLPIIIGVSAYILPSALGLYWITGNIIGILQDMYFKAKIRSGKI
jgi:YidC/Oxa1 family membrane protein insertase